MQEFQSCYISGKISGLEDLNMPKFERMENLLRFHYGTDAIIINPHTIHHPHDRTRWENFMRYDLRAMLRCRHVAVLDDWKQSRGAIIEVLLADTLKLEIFTIDGKNCIQRLNLSTLTKVQLLFKLLINRF